MIVTDSNFEEIVLNSDKIVFVDCYAKWCGPCKALKPLLTDLVNKHKDKAVLGLLDVESNPELTEKLRVTSIPKVVVFKGGEKITEFLGVKREDDYLDVINNL